MKTCEFITY